VVNPDELVDAVRDKLRLIPAVVAMVDGDDSRISSYIDGDVSLASAVYEMPTPSILVAWVGNEPGEDSQPWLHLILAYIRLGAGQRLGEAFYNICNSVATGDSQKFTETEFHQDFEQIGVPVFTRQEDEDGGEFPRIDMRFRQRSQE